MGLVPWICHTEPLDVHILTTESSGRYIQLVYSKCWIVCNAVQEASRCFSLLGLKEELLCTVQCAMSTQEPEPLSAYLESIWLFSTKANSRLNTQRALYRFSNRPVMQQFGRASLDTLQSVVRANNNVCEI